MNHLNNKKTTLNTSSLSVYDKMRREQPKALAKLKVEKPEEFKRLVAEHLNPQCDASANPDWNFRDWQKKDPKGLVKMFNQDRERFNKLKDAYGTPKNQVNAIPGIELKGTKPEFTNSTFLAPTSAPTDWFKIVSKGSRAEIIMHGYIGPYSDIDSRKFASEFKALEAKHTDIDIDLNSGGGSILDAFPIYNAINSSKANISITVTGMAASMGSILLQSAKPGNRKAYKNARIMVHKPSGGDYGSAKKLRDTADLLDSLEKTLSETYQEKTGQTEAIVNEWLQEGKDKWFTAKEALAAGLIDKIIDLAPVKEPDASLQPEAMHRFFSTQFQAISNKARSDQEAERANWNFRDWQKKDAEGLIAMYENEPERYNKLKDAYGK